MPQLSPHNMFELIIILYFSIFVLLIGFVNLPNFIMPMIKKPTPSEPKTFLIFQTLTNLIVIDKDKIYPKMPPHVVFK